MNTPQHANDDAVGGSALSGKLAAVLTTKNAHPGHPFYNKHRMSVLQEQVFALDICPACHRKLLRDGHASYGIQSVSCECGLMIFEAANLK